jgi:hypothetical protein
MDGFEDIATGMVPQKLRIGGRPRQGKEEDLLILEEPEEPVQMHWLGKLVPHYKAKCPNCEKGGEIKPFWYIGARSYTSSEPVIMELTWKCFRGVEAAARHLDESGYQSEVPLPSRFAGLVVKIRRADFPSSPRVVRCEERRRQIPAWPYQTRLELARIWGIPTKPKIYREEMA